VEWFFALVGIVVVTVIGLVVLGRETARLASAARPAVFDLTEAVDFIADRLPSDVQARISHDDVRWVLLTDADLLEEATRELPDGDDEGGAVEDLVDEDEAVARVLAAADAVGRELADEDVAAVLAGRAEYLEAIGAVGPEAQAR
jgi:hypothetical protein